MPPPDDRSPDPQAAWQKAATIGAPGIGSRYLTPLNPTTWDLIKAFLGGERPQTVAAQDPYGIRAWEAGKGPPPMLFGTTEPVEAPGIRAYHGSPHEFEKFSLSKIGTGEGAQAYGHGLYFAEAEDTARFYRDALQEAKRQAEPVTYAGQEFPRGTSTHRVLVDIAEKGKEKTIAELQQSIRFNESYAPDQANLQRHYLEFAKNVDPAKIAVPKGKMYEVNIGAHFDDFLDWDKPLSEQHPKVREALAKVGIKPLDPSLVPEAEAQLADAYQRWEAALQRRDPRASEIEREIRATERDLTTLRQQHTLTGEDMYRDVARQDALASERLREAGLPGIKYLDQGSRAAGEGSRNYVVFDDKLISILRKYGLLPPIAAGTLGLSQLARPSQPEAR